MDHREIKIERLTDVCRDEFQSFGQIMGLEDDRPLEDFPHLSFWTGNYDLGAAGEKLDGGLLLCKRAQTVVTKMERHRRTAEIFIPLTGQTVFVMAPTANEESAPDLSRVRAFLLEGDLGVALHPGTWHWQQPTRRSTAHRATARPRSASTIDAWLRSGRHGIQGL